MPGLSGVAGLELVQSDWVLSYYAVLAGAVSMSRIWRLRVVEGHL